MDALDAAMGLQVRLWRCFRGLSTDELATRLGVTPGHMVALEEGRCSFGPSRLYSVARHLEIPVSWIIPADRED